MKPDFERVDYLFQQYIQKACTKSELKELLQLHSDPLYTERIYEKYADAYSSLSPIDSNVDWNFMYNHITGTASVHKVNFFKKTWVRYAAMILILAGIGAYWLNNETQSTKKMVSAVDIPPASNRASLTLADGSTIILDSVSKGNLASQGTVTIVKLSNGSLAFNIASSEKQLNNTGSSNRNSISKPNSPETFNTITTPRGGQYQVLLSDGSKIWLNAESSVKFPTNFNDQRLLELNGEAYLEIAKNSKVPFIVKTKSGTLIEVLGTTLNINAYSDEISVKTTLVEGSVKVDNNILKPGEAYENGKIIRTDIEQDIAWKNGLFIFSGADLPSVLRELSRWYDIDIEYRGTIPERTFGGKMQRDLQLSQVLGILKKMEVNFRIEGKKLIVAP